jgi:hypothetical protein
MLLITSFDRGINYQADVASSIRYYLKVFLLSSLTMLSELETSSSS